MNGKQSALQRYLNPVAIIAAVKQGVAGKDNGTSLLMLVLGFFGLWGTIPLYIRYDILSTWDFMNGIRLDTMSEADQTAAFIASVTQSQSIATMIGALIGVGVALLPSIIELIGPALSNPAINVLYQFCVIFDYVTDWTPAWAMAGYWTNNAPLRFIATLAIDLFMAVGVQVLAVMFLTLVITSVRNIIGKRSGSASVISAEY